MESWLRRMLDLNELGNGLPAISPSFGKAIAEAAGVCLESQGHTQLTSIVVRGYIDDELRLSWPQINDQARRTWNDPEEATEYGSTAVAVLLARQELGYLAVERSSKGSGIDYWLGEESGALSFERKARLEVSGIRRGSDADIARRVRERLGRISRYAESLPAFVVVVEFSMPVAEVQRK